MDVVWKPGGIYDNYPLYPTGFSSTDVEVSIPEEPPEDIRDLLDTYEAYDLGAGSDQYIHDSIQRAVITMIDEKLSAITESLVTWTMEDFIEGIMYDVGSTFPDVTNTILGEGLSTTLGHSSPDTNMLGMEYAAIARLASGIDRASGAALGRSTSASLETLATFVNNFMSFIAQSYFETEINTFGNYQTGGLGVAD